MVLVCYDGGKKRPEDRNNDVLTIFSNFCTFHEKKEWLSIHLWEKKGEWKLFHSNWNLLEFLRVVRPNQRNFLKIIFYIRFTNNPETLIPILLDHYNGVTENVLFMADNIEILARIKKISFFKNFATFYHPEIQTYPSWCNFLIMNEATVDPSQVFKGRQKIIFYPMDPTITNINILSIFSSFYMILLPC